MVLVGQLDNDVVKGLADFIGSRGLTSCPQIISRVWTDRSVQRGARDLPDRDYGCRLQPFMQFSVSIGETEGACIGVIARRMVLPVDGRDNLTKHKSVGLDNADVAVINAVRVLPACEDKQIGRREQ